MRIGARLRALRNARGLTLADVAGSTLSVGLVSKLERDLVRPSLETLFHLAHRLDLPPGVLLVTDDEVLLARARGALAAGRAHLLLGDPGTAGSIAAGALEGLRESDPLRARLLAVAAEAALTAGGAGQAATYVRDASALTVPDWVRVEAAWVLGALERRRGALAEAERTWTSCLTALEEPPDAHPWWPYLRASVLAELGGLAEARGDVERGRNLIARAASIAAGLAQASAPAAALLAAWDESGAEALALAPGDAEPPAGPTAALTLAVVSAAERLGRRLTLEAARLERAVWAPEARAFAPDAPASRGLRRA